MATKTGMKKLPKDTSSNMFWTVTEYASMKKLSPQRVYQLIEEKKLIGYLKGETVVVMINTKSNINQTQTDARTTKPQPARKRN